MRHGTTGDSDCVTHASGPDVTATGVDSVSIVTRLSHKAVRLALVQLAGDSFLVPRLKLAPLVGVTTLFDEILPSGVRPPRSAGEVRLVRLWDIVGIASVDLPTRWLVYLNLFIFMFFF